ncbi:hypothetical protein [Pseudomonas sp. ICMP 460]|uniref:hypothetical protein n=1 Tax=Pseudomonas sp. ICMP 460 TaxID=1718917 RepID=UPI0021152070|nr:hypothetical protein [Pseudomonas sp. ICMP 460]
MSAIQTKNTLTIFSQASTPQNPAPLLPPADNPVAPPHPAVAFSPSHNQSFSATSSLRQLSLEQPAGRARRDTADQPAAAPVNKSNLKGSYPATVDAKMADIRLQKILVQWLKTGEANKKDIPKKASITPFIEMYYHAINEPAVQAWFKTQHLKPQTVRVFSDYVVGVVVRDGKETFQRFSITDGSGWGQVSKSIGYVQKVLSPNDLGLPGNPGPSPNYSAISPDVFLGFYGVKPPLNEKSAPQLGKKLSQSGWPEVAQTQRAEWAGQFKQLSQHREDSAIRTRLVEQFRSQFEGEPDTNLLNLETQVVVAGPGSALDRRSKQPRKRFLEFLVSPTFQAFLKKAGFDLPGSEVKMSEFRLSAGDLQMRNLAGDWVSLQQAFDAEVEQTSRVDDADGLSARKMNTDFDQLVTMSEKTGNALYSTRSYDARQAFALYALDTPHTVGQLRGALGWLGIQLADAPLAGDYAGMTPYSPAHGTLPAEAGSLLKKASTQVMALLKDFSVSTHGFQNYPDPDNQLAAFFDSAQAIAVAEGIAKSLKHYAVSDGQALSRADRHQLLATAMKSSVDMPMPGMTGTVAGYELYQPGNMGRTLKEVRDEVEKHLQSKGVDPKHASLMAHLFLAQSAPEMLVKKDPTVPADTARILNRDPENIKVGSTGWMNLRLGSAIAGDSRMNLTQAMALARQDGGGPKQEALIKELSTQALLDWAVMAGIFPATSDGKYSAGDYAAAAKAFTTRENQTSEAFGTLSSESPTQRSVLLQQLAKLFPEMSEQDISQITLKKYPDFSANAANSRSLVDYPNSTPFIYRRPTSLVDIVLKNLVEGNPPFGEDESWVTDEFIHPNISLAAFRERLDQLPDLKPLVVPAVDKFITDTRAAQATALKLMIADLPLNERKALEVGKITFYSLRKTTGDTLQVDLGQNSNVEKSKGTHGLLLRYETDAVWPKFGYYEVFPGSMKMVKRTDLPVELQLDGKVENRIVSAGPHHYLGPVIRNGRLQGFDFDAYSTGSAPRSGAQSTVIIERLGAELPETPTPDNKALLPNSFFSGKTSKIVDRLLAHSFDDNREARIAHANEPTALQGRTFANPFTAENARKVISLIPFVGAIADLVEGKIEAGVKGLLIDLASFLATGGLAGAKLFGKGLKMLIPFSGKPFSMAGLKGGASFIRGVFNPLENVPALIRAGPNGVRVWKRLGDVIPVNIAYDVYLPVKAFEQLRWSLGAWDTVQGTHQPDSQWPGARKGLSANQEVIAVQKNGSWYAINPVSHRPEGVPLEQFTPESS